jgi:hypothetical protein
MSSFRGFNIITQQSTNTSVDDDSIEDEHVSNVPFYASRMSRKSSNSSFSSIEDMSCRRTNGPDGNLKSAKEGSEPSLGDTNRSTPTKSHETSEAKVVSEERPTRKSCKRITAVEWLSHTPKRQRQLRLEERRKQNEKKKDGIKIGALVKKKLVCYGLGDNACAGTPKMVFGTVVNTMAKGYYKIKFENGFLLSLFHTKFTFITNTPKKSVLACDDEGMMTLNTAGGLKSSWAEAASKNIDKQDNVKKKW